MNAQLREKFRAVSKDRSHLGPKRDLLHDWEITY